MTASVWTTREPFRNMIGQSERILELSSVLDGCVDDWKGLQSQRKLWKEIWTVREDELASFSDSSIDG